MEVLNKNFNFTSNSPEIKHRLESQENFSALDKDKLVKDTAEFAKNQTEEIKKENFLFRTMRNIGVSNPKKTLISFLCSVGTVIGVAVLANKSNLSVQKFADKIDDFLTGDNIIGKARRGIAGLFKGLKKATIDKLPTPKFITNAKKALENPVKPKWSLFRGLENGAKGLFANTIVETIQTGMEKNKDAVMETLKNLMGGDAAKAQSIISDMANLEKVKFADKFIAEVANVHKGKKLTEVFTKLSEGEFGDGLSGIVMDKGGLFGSWWPANAVNNALKKITKKDNKYLLGNLGDSALKYASIRGKLHKTLPAKALSIIPPLCGDQVSNFVNDKSGFGVLLCANLMGNFNKLQDAPKNKKLATATNDVATGSLSWLAGMPLAYGTVYSLASLSKMGGKDILSRLARGIGKIFAFGLNSNKGKLGGVSGVLGGLGRFALVFFVLQPFINKRIEKICSKIFGKPYDPNEEKQKKMLEEAQNQVIPELGITQKEFLEKAQAHPEVMEKLQKDPMLQREVNANPKVLLDLLDGKDVNKSSKGVILSPANKNLISRNNKVNTNSDKKQPTNNTSTSESGSIDTATYIPSSEFKVQKDTADEVQKSEINKILENADKALNRAAKYF